jgi:L-ribulose-5-phosphate 3-epimerase
MKAGNSGIVKPILRQEEPGRISARKRPCPPDGPIPLYHHGVRKSIGDNLIPEGWSFEKGLELIKKAGFDGVELWLGEKPWFKMETTDAAVRELLRKVHAAGLVVSNVANSLDWDENVAARDPRIQAAARRHVERQIETAQLLETDAILVVAGVVTEAAPYNEVYKRTVGALQALGERAAQAKVKIGCENCNSEQHFLLSPREFWQFLNDVNHPWVGIHLDVGNIHDTGFPEQWIEIHGPRITRIHVKDVLRKRGRCGDQGVYTNLFLGDNNWAAIRAALDKAGYGGWIIAEMETRYRFAPDQQFYDTAAAMERFISGRL